MQAASGPLDLWWLGQSGFLVAHDGRYLLLDPYLSDSLTRKYAGTDKPHVRMTERVIDPAQLGFVDVVTASHGHTDHLDPDTLRALPDAELVAPEAHRELATERAGRPPTGIDDGETVIAAGFAITAVPAAHEEIERDDAGRMLHLGYVVRCGPFALYHAGDTIRYDGMAERVGGGIDVALLPVNGRAPERGVAGNLNGREAAAWRTRSARGWPSRCTSRCSSSTPSRRTRSRPRASASASPTGCCGRASDSRCLEQRERHADLGSPAGRRRDRERLGEVRDQRQPQTGARAVHARRHPAALVAHDHAQLSAVPLDADRERTGQ